MRKFLLNSNRFLGIATSYILYIGLKLLSSNNEIATAIAFVLFAPYFFLDYTTSQYLLLTLFRSIGLFFLAIITFLILLVIVGVLRLYELIKGKM